MCIHQVYQRMRRQSPPPAPEITPDFVLDREKGESRAKACPARSRRELLFAQHRSARDGVPQVWILRPGKARTQPRRFTSCNHTAGVARFNPKYSTANHPRLSSEINAIIPCEIAQ